MRPKHLYLLDILRGLASLSIVLWHYQHFFWVSAEGSTQLQRATLPLYAILWPFYDKGYVAVDVFFGISGLVFYYLYSEALYDRAVSWRQFWLFRFSRLYPLHFITLLYVAALQAGVKAELGNYFVYSVNTPEQFVLNLFFVQHWMPDRKLSFNGPAWSVSVEILLYAVFFLVATARPTVGGAAVMTALGAVLWNSPIHDIGRGVECFFAGGLAYFLFRRIGFRPLSFGRPFRLIGDITYSTYLLHFPLQLTAAFWIGVLGLTIDFTRPIWLFGYLGAVIGLSIPCYYAFELPAQKWLRSLTASQLSKRPT